MAVKEVTGWTIICDHPDCGRDAMDDVSDGEYSSWNDLAELKELATNDHDWALGPDGKWGCPRHATTGERPFTDPMPLPPPLFGEGS